MRWAVVTLLVCSAIAVRSVAQTQTHTHRHRPENKKTTKKSYSEQHCVPEPKLVEEIASYDAVVRDILDYVLRGPFKHRTYNELGKFVDKFGPRMSGSKVLEDSIDYMVNLTKQENIRDIVTESVEVPRYIRGKESLVMTKPRFKKMAVLGLGFSVNTPKNGIEAEVVVVKSFDELNILTEKEVSGKIVLFNVNFTKYEKTVTYRNQGASKAARKGAIAALVRSVTPFSINSPHTGSMTYENNVTKIPSASITVEDAELIARLKSKGEKVILQLTLFSTIGNSTSRNTIIDLKGSTLPEKLVIVSGHIDSWDVGNGAMDDGGGMFISWAVPVILKNLNLKPHRTIRTIFWTAEELGYIGAKAYKAKHENESNNVNIIMESDEGTFKPKGLAVGGTQEARCMIAEILKLFKSIGASELVEENSPGSDITVLRSNSIPSASFLNANEKYFWFHHTEGDTMTVENPDDLDLGAAFWTAVSYVIADISTEIPK